MQRNTRQKQVMLKVLKEANKPMSIGEIYERVKLELPTIAKSTLYRNMDTLLSGQLVDKYYMNDTEVFYQIRGNQNTHAHYLVCESCKRMYHLPHCPLHGLEDYLEETGFLVKEHYIQISGICKECRENMKTTE